MMSLNRPHSIYQYFNFAPTLSQQTSLLGGVFLVSKSLLKTCKMLNLWLCHGISMPFQKISKLFQHEGLEFPWGGGGEGF